MTDIDQPDNLAEAVQDWTANANAYAACKQALFPENRTAIFDTLERHAIQTVTMSFDGYGDSGQIDDVSVAAGKPHNLAAIDIEQKQARWGKDAIETITLTLRTAIEDLGYAFLEETHCGWENNEGGSGEFVFDVAARAIALDFHERYVSTESYHHEL
jgi:hypothetical protein